MRLSQFTERHPYWFVVILEVAVVVVYLTTGTIAYLLKLSNMAVIGLANLGLTLIVIVILTTQGWWKTIGFRLPTRRGDLFYYFVPLIPMFLNLMPGVLVQDTLFVTGVFFVTLMVGFAEETIFRGLMLHVLKARGLWGAAIGTASLFGLTHALNALAGKSILDSVFQICYAAAIGFAYAALVLKKDILWPLVLTHFLTDFIYFIQKPGYTLPSFWQSLIIVSLTIVFTVYGSYVMRNKSKECDDGTRAIEQLVQPSGNWS